MNQTVILNGQEVRCHLRVSARARQLRLTINEASEVVVSLPNRAKPEMAWRFIHAKSAWILRQLGRLQTMPVRQRLPGGQLHFRRHKALARRLVIGLIEELNPVYAGQIKRVMVRDQKTRWGSCSRDGRLSFSYKVLFLPPHLQRYIVAHELAHLKEFNHSSSFWAWVSKTVPEHQEVRKELKKWSLR